MIILPLEKSPNRISQNPLLKGALGIGLVLGGMALEARLKVFQQFGGGKKTPAIAQAPEVQPAPAPEAAPVVVAEAPDPDAGLMKEADVPEHLKAAHAIVRKNPELLAWYRKTLTEWKTELEGFRTQVEGVTNERAFGVGRDGPRFPQKEMEERRERYVKIIEKRIVENELHLLAMMTATGIETNPDIGRRLLLSHTPGYQAHVDLSIGGLYGFNVMGLADPDRDNKKLYSHGVSRDGKSTLKIDLNDTWEEKRFHDTVTHEEFHGVYQANARVSKQHYNQYLFADSLELLGKPIIEYKENMHLKNEALYEGITEMLACQTGQLEGKPETELMYKPLVASAILLSSINRDALISWYTGMMTTEDAYNALRGAMVDKGVPDAEAVGMLNRAFEDKGRNEQGGYAAAGLALALQRATKQDLPSLTQALKLPPAAAKLLETYDIGSLRNSTPEEVRALCTKDEAYLEIIGDRKVIVPISTIGAHVYLHDNTDAVALSAVAYGMGRGDRKAQNIAKTAVKLNPNNTTVQRRLGRAHDVFNSYSDMGSSWEYNKRHYDAALAAWEQTRQLDPQDNATRFEIALLKLKHAVARAPKDTPPDAALVDAALEEIRASLKDEAHSPDLWSHRLYDLYERSTYSFSFDSWEPGFREHQDIKDRVKAIREEAEKNRRK